MKIKGVISGSLNEIYTFPNPIFSQYAYEGWGNVLASIDGIEWYYYPTEHIRNYPECMDDVDILLLEIGIEDVIAQCHKDTFIIGTESGAAYELDRRRQEFKGDYATAAAQCDVILATTYGGEEYLSMMVDTPILNIPLPMDMSLYYPRNTEKYPDFTVCLGEILECCMDDRPLNIMAANIAGSMGAKVVAALSHLPNTGFGSEELNELTRRTNTIVDIQEFQFLNEISHSYMPKSHVSMMLAQRSTFGRMIYVSWAIGVPCIATRYQLQEDICPELTVDYCEIKKIRELLVQLRDDQDFYQHCKAKGLEGVRRTSEANIANRLLEELLPIFIASPKSLSAKAKNE